MGIENNNAIIAITQCEEEVSRIRKWIEKIDDDFWEGLFIISDKKTNDKTTVVMVPDGSKEGWSESNYGDKLRDNFITEIQKSDYEDGSNPWEFVEVGFGEYGQKVLRGNCKNCYGSAEYAVG